MARREIRIAGFGGQGVVLSGNIIGRAASVHGNGFAALMQSYGPESRGGSCRAEVVISDTPIDYPYVVNPELQIILSQEAYADFGHKVKPGTLLIVDSEMVNLNSSKNKPLSVPASRMAKEMGHPIVANIIVLGFLAAISDIVPVESLKKAILDSIPKGTESFNLEAFELGYNYGVEHGGKARSQPA